VLGLQGFVEEHQKEIMALGRLKDLSRVLPEGDAVAVIPIRDLASGLAVDLWIPLQGLVNPEAETSRLRKEIEKVKADIEFVANKLSKESFIAKAPPELVEKEKKKQQDLAGKLKELEEALKRTSKLK
jgi:valyl-tRNA synthetase